MKKKPIVNAKVNVGDEHKAEISNDNLEIRSLDAVGEYLKAKGYVILVISFDRVQGPVDRSSNYELVVRFLGTPPKKKTSIPAVDGRKQ